VIKSEPSAFRRVISNTTADTWIGVLMLIAAVVYWLEANKIRISPLDGPVGASGLPKSLAYVLALLSVVLIVRGVSETPGLTCSLQGQRLLKFARLLTGSNHIFGRLVCSLSV